MKKLLSVILNVLTLGIPLFIRVLSQAKSFTALVNAKAHVSLVIHHDRQPVIQIEVCNCVLSLDVDEFIDAKISTQ